MKVGVIGAGTMGQGIAKAFAMVDGYTVALCDIKQEWAEGGKDKIAKGYAKLVEKGKISFKENNCPDKICISAGKISQPGQVAVCMPAKLIIEIIGGESIADAVTG